MAPKGFRQGTGASRSLTGGSSEPGQGRRVRTRWSGGLPWPCSGRSQRSQYPGALPVPVSVPRYCSATQVPSCSDVGGPCEGWGGLRQRTSPVLSVSSTLPVTPRQPPVLPVTPGQPTPTASPVSPTRKAPPVRPRQPSPPVPSSAPGVPTWAQGLLHSSQAATARPRAPPTPPSSTSPCPVGLGGPFLAPRVPSCHTAGLVSAGPGGRWGSTADRKSVV